MFTRNAHCNQRYRLFSLYFCSQIISEHSVQFSYVLSEKPLKKHCLSISLLNAVYQRVWLKHTRLCGCVQRRGFLESNRRRFKGSKTSFQTGLSQVTKYHFTRISSKKKAGEFVPHEYVSDWSLKLDPFWMNAWMFETEAALRGTQNLVKSDGAETEFTNLQNNTTWSYLLEVTNTKMTNRLWLHENDSTRMRCWW